MTEILQLLFALLIIGIAYQIIGMIFGLINTILGLFLLPFILLGEAIAKKFGGTDD